MDGTWSPPRRATAPDARSTSTSPPRSTAHASRKPAGRPQAFALHSSTPRHILLPTTRTWPPPHTSARSPRHMAKLTKRHGSVDLTQSPSLAAVVHEHAWLEHLAKLDVQVLESGVELFGYQVFVVEQWLVDRAKVVRTVTVYTGNPRDRILVTILGPVPTLSPGHAEDLFQRTLLEFRKDGARPRETEKGVILITSLASFRSDLNIVHIPNGDVLAVKDDLFVNINLQRLGASGRSGLNLDEPNASSKEKFMQMYGISEPASCPNRKTWFKDTVLELVRTVQSALSLFGMFSLATDGLDGLICDSTFDGMQQWVVNIGVDLRLEPMEKSIDAPAVAALLGMVTSLRSKLSALAIPQVPKDPFLDHIAFLHSLPQLRRDRDGRYSAAAASPPSNSSSSSATIHFIDWEFIHRVQSAYAKIRQTEPYKVHRVLKNKLEDLTTVSTSLATNLNLSLRSSSADPSSSRDRDNDASGSSAVGVGHALGLTGSTTPLVRADTLLDSDIIDIDTLVKVVTNSSKSDIPASLRDIWAGRPGYHRQQREAEDASRAAAMASLSAKYPLGLGGTWDEGEDNSYAGMIWRGTGGRLQRKGQDLAHGIAGWTGRDGHGRKHKHSVDGALESDTSGPTGSTRPSLLPSVVITSDKSPDVTDHEDRDRDTHSNNPYSPAPSYRSPASSVTNLSDYDRGIRKFNGMAAPLDVVSLRAIGVTHSAPTAPTLARAAKEAGTSALLLPGVDNVRAASTSVESVLLPEDLALAFEFPGHLGMADGSVHQRWKRRFAFATGFTDDMAVLPEDQLLESGLDDKDLDEDHHRAARLSRRRSISDIGDFAGLPVLETQYMQIDVELAFQYVLLREKETNMRNASKVLEILMQSLGCASDKLSDTLAPQLEVLPEVSSRLDTLTTMTREGRNEANILKRRAETSKYQGERLLEGADRLDHTLRGYRRRMEDVEQAVQGLYVLEPYAPADSSTPDEKEEEDDPGGTERAASPGAEESTGKDKTTTMSDTETTAPSSSRTAVIDAVAARVASSHRDLASELQERANQDEKRALRRIIYSGIERNNDAKLALEATKVLQKLAKNILDHPGEEKYMQFKTTNSTIQRTLIAPKNTLEYAIAIGFRADVKNFQPLYVFNPTRKNLTSLRNGLECLEEYISREEAKLANSRLKKETLQEAEAKQRALVKLAYDEDRREKQMRDAMEKERRDALALAHAQAALEAPQHTAAEEDMDEDIPAGGGHRVGAPPPYPHPHPHEAPFSILPLRGADGVAVSQHVPEHADGDDDDDESSVESN